MHTRSFASTCYWCDLVFSLLRAHSLTDQGCIDIRMLLMIVNPSIRSIRYVSDDICVLHLSLRVAVKLASPITLRPRVRLIHGCQSRYWAAADTAHNDLKRILRATKPALIPQHYCCVVCLKNGVYTRQMG